MWSALCLLLGKALQLREEGPDRTKPALLSDLRLGGVGGSLGERLKEDAENVSHSKTHKSVSQSMEAFTEGSDEGRQQTRLRGTQLEEKQSQTKAVTFESS